MKIGYENETEYKQEILKLNKQIEGFLNMFDSMSEPYIRVDEELRLTYANDAACVLLETHKDQLESMRITDFLDVIPLNNQEVSSTLKTSNESERQIIQLHTGALKQIEFIRMGSLSEGQQFYRLRDVTLDVSSSRETGMSRQMFLDIFDTAIESIVLFDSSGIIMEVNHAFIHALAIPKKEIVGKNMRDLISPDYRGYWDESIQRAFDESNYKGR